MSTNQNGGKSNNDWFSWGMIVFFFAFGMWPIALIWLFLKLFAPDERKRRTTAIPPLRVDPTVGRQTSYQSSAQTAKPKNPVQKMTQTPAMKSSTAKTLKIIGFILAVMGAYLTLGPAASIATWGATSGEVWSLLRNLAMAAGGIGMFVSGISMEKAMARYARYLAVIGDFEAVSFAEISRKLGYSQRRIIKDLQKMIEKGYFGGKAYLNMELGYFFRSVEADAAWEKEQKKAAKKPPKEAEEGYSGILRNIRRANDQIADPVLTEKISHLEDVTAKIFRAVEEDPKKRNRIDTFLNYYLPTTQKLLDSYAEFEATGIEGENLRDAKERIRSTMDSIIAGFEHQLDELYKSDVMDVDSDIRVMESMLQRDTGSVEADFGIKGGKRVASSAKPDSAAAPIKPSKATDVDMGGAAAQELKKPE